MIDINHQLYKNVFKSKNINMSVAKISNFVANRGCIHGAHKFGRNLEGV